MSRSSPKAAVASRRAAASASGSRSGVADRAHALAAAAGRRLDEERDSRSCVGRRDEGVVRLVGLVVAGEDRDAERGGEPAGGGLVAHRADRRGRRADPADPGRDDGLGEVGVLGEEPEARVDGVGAGRAGGRDDRVDVEQVEGVGAVGRGHDRPDAEPVARPGDPRRDLAAVRDEQGPDRGAGGPPTRRRRTP